MACKHTLTSVQPSELTGSGGQLVMVVVCTCNSGTGEMDTGRSVGLDE